MKKLSSAVSVLLALALVLVSMPKARAAELTLQGSCIVEQYLAITPEDDGTILLALVSDTDGEWGPCCPTPSSRNIFQLDGGFLQPGAGGTYDFRIKNVYGDTISYTLTAKGFLNLDGEWEETEFITLDITGGDLAGDLAPGEEALFTLEWLWDSPEISAADSALGVLSASDGLQYKAELKFYVTADELPNPPPDDDCGLCKLLTGLGVGKLVIGTGGLIIGGLTLPWLTALPLLPVLLLLSCCLHGGQDCPPPDCPPEPTRVTEPADPSRGGDTAPDDLGPFKPPNTGDSWNAALLAGLGIVLASGIMIEALRRRKRENS